MLSKSLIINNINLESQLHSNGHALVAGNIRLITKSRKQFVSNKSLGICNWDTMRKLILISVALVAMFTAVPLVLASSVGQHFNVGLSQNLDDLAALLVVLQRMPEPRSLFVLGGVLFSLALFVFWKAAKSSKEF